MRLLNTQGANAKNTCGRATQRDKLLQYLFWIIIQYQKEFTKKETLIDHIVKAIAKSSKCEEYEAAERLLNGICPKYEDTLFQISIEK
jgi:hypothetical protein